MNNKIKRPTDNQVNSLRRSMQSVKLVYENKYHHSDARDQALLDHANLRCILRLCLDVQANKTLFE